MFPKFTLKTSRQLREEASQKKMRDTALATPRGLDGFLSEEQKKLDDLRASVTGFLNDIHAHFEGSDVEVYLTDKFLSRSKEENITKPGQRRYAIKWPLRVSGTYVQEISFVYTETGKGVRTDYIINSAYGNVEMVNDEFSDGDSPTKMEAEVEENFRTVYRFENHEAFTDSTRKLPEAFVARLRSLPPI
jgi:hypothetical protein